VLRRFTRLKAALMPYLYGQAVVAATEGTPVLRPMAVEFPDDPCLHPPGPAIHARRPAAGGAGVHRVG
jgi:hypothetical protein